MCSPPRCRCGSLVGCERWGPRESERGVREGFDSKSTHMQNVVCSRTQRFVSIVVLFISASR